VRLQFNRFSLKPGRRRDQRCGQGHAAVFGRGGRWKGTVSTHPRTAQQPQGV